MSAYEDQLETLMKRMTQYLVSKLDERGDLVDRVQDLVVQATDVSARVGELEETINSDNEDIVTEDRVREIAVEEATEAINNAEVNVDISA